MKRSEIEKHLFNYSSELYSFSYALIPDDLQAQQIVLDAISVFIVEEKEMFEELEDGSIWPENLMRKSLYGHVYRIARKRYPQLISSLKEQQQLFAFHHLAFDEKAVIYFKHKTSLSSEEICQILEISSTDFLSKLATARETLGQTEDSY